MLKKILLCGLLFACTGPALAKGAAEYEVTEILLVEDFEDGDRINILGGNSAQFDDQDNGGKASVSIVYDYAPGVEASRHCVLINYDLNFAPGSSIAYTGYSLGILPEREIIDLSDFFGLRFYARGKGRFSARLGTDATRRQFNYHRSPEFTLKKDWTLYEIPFSKFEIVWGEFQPWDPAAVYLIEWGFEGQQRARGEMFIDNIGFYKVAPLDSQAESDMDHAAAGEAVQVNQKKLAVVKGKRVAIVGFETKQLDETIASALMDFMINAFVNQGTMVIVDRSSIEKILAEQQFQLEDFADTSKMISIGKLAGAEFIVTGNLSRVSETYYLSIKLISVETAEIVGSSIAQARDDTEFFEKCNTAVLKMFE